MDRQHRFRPLKSTGTTVLTYSLLFCILMAGIFAMFILSGRSFVNHADAYDQGYFWTVEMKHNLQSLFSGEGYPMWSWDRGTGLDTKMPVDPFLVTASLFPAGLIELGYTVAIILRLYFAGLAFLFFCREAGMTRFQQLAGSLCYVSSTWVINLSLMQGQFVDLLILFPLLVMGVDRIYKGGSPLVFILAVGLSVGVNYYLAYMAAIGIIIFIFFRYFTFHSFSLRGYAAYIGRFVLYGIAGIMIGAVFILVTLRNLSGASTGEAPSVSWLYGARYYLGEGMRLVSTGYEFSYTNIGIPILALLALPAFKGKPSIKATHVIMTAVMLGMTFFPFFGSMFNGFGYVSNRWYFMLVFFLCWCAAEHMEIENLCRVRNIIVMLIWWAVLAISTLGFAYLDIIGDLSLREACILGGQLAAGLVMILIAGFGDRVLKSLSSVRTKQAVLTVCMIGTLVTVWNLSFYGRTGYFFRVGQINEQLEASTQRAGSMIEDEGFYRIDQMDWINSHLSADQPVNENLWWQNNTMYLYDSKIPSRLSLFNKLLGNNLGYSKRVYVQSNGGRMGLDFLYGVKYFLGDDTKNERTGADAYAGYSFSEYGTLDGVNVFKSKYSPSLGFVYDRYMPESEFMKLSRLEREQALLQAMVIPDSELEESAPEGEDTVWDEERLLTAQTAELDVEELPYEVVSADGCTLTGRPDKGEACILKAKKDKASVTVRVRDVERSQLILSFDGLTRRNGKGKTVGDFKLKCSDDRLAFEVNNTKNNQTIPGIVDFDMNMGYRESFSGELTVTFSRKGTYEFDRMYVSAMSVDNFDKYASLRSEAVYEVTAMTSDKVTGTLSTAGDGYLFLSMPVNDNWDVYIDGLKTAEIHNANIAFFGTPVTGGEHSVEIRYDYTARYIAFGITAAGLILMTVICLAERIRRRRDSEAEEDK